MQGSSSYRAGFPEHARTGGAVIGRFNLVASPLYYSPLLIFVGRPRQRSFGILSRSIVAPVVNNINRSTTWAKRVVGTLRKCRSRCIVDNKNL